VALKITNHLVIYFWIYDCECNLADVLIVNGINRSTQIMTKIYSFRLCYFEWEQLTFLAFSLLIFHLTYLTSEIETSNAHCSTSCVISVHVMVILIVFSALVCPTVPDKVNIHDTRTVIFVDSLND
jgi:hypothetical protein